jgi:hypothetical protein
MSTKTAELVQMLDDSRAALNAALEGIDPGRVLYGEWQIKHFLAHIAGWDEVTIAALRALGRGNAFEIPVYQGIDDFNRRSVEARREQSFERIQADWVNLREELKRSLAALPPAILEQPMLLPWGQNGTAEGLIRIMIEHEFEHAEGLHKQKDGI